MSHPLDFRRLRSFTVVAETLHFGRAAERLNIAQPALTQQIQQLERDLGTQLLVRDRRSVHLTKTGELFLMEAHKALQQMERASLVASRARRGEIGHVEISHVSSVAYSGLLSHVCFDFQQMFPDVRLDVRESDLEHQLQDLSDNRVDVAFIRLPAGPLPDNVLTLTLDQENIFVCLRADHPLAHAPVDLKMLAVEPFVLTHLRRGLGFYDAVLRACHAAGFEPNVVYQSRQFVSIVALVAAGRGVALVPESVCRLQLPDVVYLPLANHDTRSEVAIAYRDNEDAAAVCRFIELCRRWAQGHPSDSS